MRDLLLIKLIVLREFARNFTMKNLFIAFVLFIAITTYVESTTVYLVRHGQTNWNLIGRIQSVEDVPINEKGKRQAKVLAQKLKHIPFQSVYTSGLKRTGQTAAILLEGRSMEIETDKRFAERNFGHWEGRFKCEYLASDIKERGDVESDASVAKRVFEALGDVAHVCKTGNVLIVSHGSVLRNVVTSLLNLPSHIVKPENTAYVVLDFHNGEWKITEMHHITHRL
jgi:broad specificity phosphatase PhoE